MRLRVVRAVALDGTRLPRRAAAERRNRIDQGQELGDVVAIGGGQLRDERDPVCVGENMMLRPGLAAIGRVRSSFFPRATRGATSCRPRPGRDRARRAAGVPSAARHAGVSRRPPVATAPTAANTSSRSRSSFRAAACSRAPRCAARTGCPLTPPGPGSVSGRRIGDCAVDVSAAAARSVPITHRRGSRARLHMVERSAESWLRSPSASGLAAASLEPTAHRHSRRVAASAGILVAPLRAVLWSDPFRRHLCDPATSDRARDSGGAQSAG